MTEIADFAAILFLVTGAVALAVAFVVVREFVVEMGVGTAMGFAGALALLPSQRSP